MAELLNNRDLRFLLYELPGLRWWPRASAAAWEQPGCSKCC